MDVRLLLIALAPVLCSAQPLFDKYCVSCHGDKSPAANLNLREPPADTATWTKILDRLASRRMPPPGLPAPTAAEIESASAAIRQKIGANSAPDPGRVTARRLNRVEYDNTIRDLLGVTLKPSTDFPVDDSGYGFDNIGDVLSVSPMLMEKYMTAARRVARVAIFGDAYPTKPTVLTRLLAKRSHDAGGNLANTNYLPYSMRGALYGDYRFPVDGEYEFRVRVANFRGQDEEDLPPADRERLRAKRAELRKRPRGERKPLTAEEIQALNDEARNQAPPRKVVLTLDGTPVVRGVVEGTTTFDYDRGEFIGRVAVKAGEHFLRASYPELADLEDPRLNLNRDMRRKLFVDYLDIIGPFQPSPEPPASYRHIFRCSHAPATHSRECARAAIAHLARRAYRRPAAPQELSGLNSLAESVLSAGDSVEDAVRIALQAMLASPQFLFRIEKEPPSDKARPISDYELASRLSYFLWASMPDETLFELAGKGTLRQPAVLQVQVRRMLADNKARNLTTNFAAQWLQLRNLERSKPDPQKFPAVDDELLDAMRTETSMFLDAFLREDRDMTQMLDAPFTFLNGPLARHYGIQGVDGEEFRRVTLDPSQRSGLLGQASILTVSSYSTRTSPVIRGKWVLENLLGTPPPPAPPNVPQLDESKIGSAASLRQQLEAHRANPACAVCHKQMDAIGFGLEGFDASGASRTHDGKFPVDTAGVMPDGTAFSGAADLKQILKKRDEAFSRNLVEKTLTYALGRGTEPADRTAIEAIRHRFAAGNYKFATLATEIAASAPFQMRRPEPALQGANR